MNLAKLNEYKMKFKKTTDLNQTERKALWFLEARSMINHGDTKIYTVRLAKLLEIGERQLYRILDKLEKLGFIARKTKRGFDIDRFRGTLRSGFYSVRIFRCYRVLMAFHFIIHKKLPWKTDIREPADLTHNVPIEWSLQGDVYFDGKTHSPLWTNWFELFQWGTWDQEVMEINNEYVDHREYQEKRGFDLLGYEYKIQPQY